MHVSSAQAIVLACSLVNTVAGLSSNVAQLRLSPDPMQDSSSSGRVSLNAVEANAVVAHHLGVSGYEHLPVTNNKQWEQALGASEGSATGQKVVIVLECPTRGCDDSQCSRPQAA